VLVILVVLAVVVMVELDNVVVVVTEREPHKDSYDLNQIVNIIFPKMNLKHVCDIWFLISDMNFMQFRLNLNFWNKKFVFSRQFFTYFGH
jgi:hypothetical protein